MEFRVANFYLRLNFLDVELFEVAEVKDEYILRIVLVEFFLESVFSKCAEG